MEFYNKRKSKIKQKMVMSIDGVNMLTFATTKNKELL